MRTAAQVEQFARARANRRYRRLTAEQLFWRNVQKSDGCWLWTGARQGDGYGVFAATREDGSKPQIRAHRFSYELHHGPVPDGYVVCHRCDNPPCVNPAHLFAGTQAENQHDKAAKGRARTGNTGKTHCKRGHAFTPENTMIVNRGKSRACRACYEALKASRRVGAHAAEVARG